MKEYLFALSDRFARISVWKWLIPTIVVSLAAWVFVSTRPISNHYRITMEIAVDGVVHIGSGVIEVNWYPTPKSLEGLANGGSGASNVRGEAPGVDRGDRGLLFVLLSGPELKDRGSGASYFSGDPEMFVLNAYPTRNVRTKPARSDDAAPSPGEVEVPVSRLPMLVRFRDINNPLSVEKVDPNDLTPAFGPGVRFARATISITDQPITTGIIKTLPWLEGLRANLDGTVIVSSNTLAGTLGVPKFKR